MERTIVRSILVLKQKRNYLSSSLIYCICINYAVSTVAVEVFGSPAFFAPGNAAL